MNAINIAAAASPVFNQPKKTIAPWLNVLADIHAKYFYNNTTTFTIEEIRNDVIKNNTHLPLRELAAVLGVVEKQHAEAMAKRAH